MLPALRRECEARGPALRVQPERAAVWDSEWRGFPFRAAKLPPRHDVALVGGAERYLLKVALVLLKKNYIHNPRAL